MNEFQGAFTKVATEMKGKIVVLLSKLAKK